jgi:hypothetical protein
MTRKGLWLFIMAQTIFLICLVESLSFLIDNIASWPQFIRYRDLLVRTKLLIPSNEAPTQHYEITPKGERYLQLFGEIEDDLKCKTILLKSGILIGI